MVVCAYIYVAPTNWRALYTHVDNYTHTFTYIHAYIHKLSTTTRSCLHTSETIVRKRELVLHSFHISPTELLLLWGGERSVLGHRHIQCCCCKTTHIRRRWERVGQFIGSSDFMTNEMRIVCCWSFEEQRKRVGDRNACDECASAEVSESVDEWMNER